MKNAFKSISENTSNVNNYAWRHCGKPDKSTTGSWNEQEALAETKGPIHIAIPAKIGCGLAGGDWNIVKQMLIDEFENDPRFRVSVCSIDGTF